MEIIYYGNTIPDLTKNKATKIIVKEGVEKIPGSAFECCDNLESVIIPNTVKKIGNYAFSHCENLKEVQLSPGLEEIGAYAFNKCSKLESITIPDTVISIDDGCFYGCNIKEVELTNVIEIPLLSFANCSNLEKIYLSNDIMKIGQEAFCSCDALKEIYLPERLKKIDKNAFANCKNLAKVYFQNKSALISPSAFNNCNLEPNNHKEIVLMCIQNYDDYFTENDFIALNIDIKDSEFVQEILAIDPYFYLYATKEDREVFMEAVLDDIIEVDDNGDHYVISSELCDITIEKNGIRPQITMCNNPIRWITLEDKKYKDIIYEIINSYKEQNKIQKPRINILKNLLKLGADIDNLVDFEYTKEEIMLAKTELLCEQIDITK